MAGFSRRELMKMAGAGLSTAAMVGGSQALPEARGSGAKEDAIEGDPGHSPYHREPVTFYVHRLGTDHAEGIAAIDMNGDGLVDITSGAYWYENPGPAGGEWKRHKFRQLAPEPPSAAPAVENKPFWDEFVADNGEFLLAERRHLVV